MSDAGKLCLGSGSGLLPAYCAPAPIFCNGCDCKNVKVVEKDGHRFIAPHLPVWVTTSDALLAALSQSSLRTELEGRLIRDLVRLREKARAVVEIDAVRPLNGPDAHEALASLRAELAS